MKISQLAGSFDFFEDKPVIISTKIPASSSEGMGVMSFRGVLVDKDDFMVYLGFSGEEITSAIRWEDIVSIEIFTDDEIREELKGEAASGFKN